MEIQAYSYQLTDTLPLGLALKQPITIAVEKDEVGRFLATDQFSTVYGYGTTADEALEDYRASLAEYYLLLEESQAMESNALLISLQRYVYHSAN